MAGYLGQIFVIRPGNCIAGPRELVRLAVAGGTLRFCSNREANGDENGQQRTLEASSLDLTISLAVVSTFDQSFHEISEHNHNDESFLHMPGRSKEQIPLPQAGTKPCLTEDIYNQALHQLSAGAMTAKELEIRVGRTGNDVDINNLRTNLVRGRAFITVFTHVDHLMTDQPKVKGLRTLIQQLNNMGCLRCFLVNVKDSVDWPEQRYQEFCQAHSEGSQAVYDELLSMCGIPRLLKELQKRQLDHMLSQRHRLLGNLTAVASKLDVTDYPQGEKEVADRLRDVLARITADVKRLHREGLSSLKSRDDQATQVPTNFQANVQAARTLRRFTENAFNDAMKAVMLGWTEEDIKILGNNTLMLNYHTHAWNKTIQGLPLVTNDDHAVLACGELLDILQNFIMWRAEIHFRDKHLRMEQFSAFVSEYCKDKATMLRQDFRVLSEELFYTLPSIQASQIYLFFESQQEQVTKLLGKEGDLVTALMHNSGTWKLPVALKPRNEEFQRQLEVAQRRIKLLAFFAMSNLVENLSRRMTYIIFAKTYDVMAQSTWTCAPLTSFDLEAVFRHYFGDTIRRQSYDQQPAYYSPHQQQTYQQAGYQQAPPGQGQASYAPQDYPRAQLNMGNGRGQF
ncbi:hypothetical protein WJX79_009086 [Trebouxia sp. C0005]